MKTESKGSKITTVIITLICIALAATIIYKTLTGTEAEVRTAPPATTTVANVYADTVTGSEFTKTVRLYGKVENSASDVSAVTSTAGYVTQVLVEKGDVVAAGDILGYIDASTAGSSYKASPVEAKSAGTITDVSAVLGSYLTAGSTFATITPSPDYYISVQVPEKYVFDIAVGSEARLSSSLDSTLSIDAAVDYIDTRVASTTNTFTAELEPASIDGLREGMTITVDLITKKLEGVFVIPMDSVTAMSDGTYAYVIEGGQAKLRKIELGDNNATSYVVLSGLSEGDAVVTEGTVSDGTSVNVLTRSN